MKKYECFYRQYIGERQSGGFARPGDVLDSLKKIDLKAGHFDFGGFPLVSDGKSAWIDDQNGHVLIDGSTDTGKSRRFIMPLIKMLLRAGHSIVCLDDKGELYDETSGEAKALGYDLVVLNLRTMRSGDQWNPLTLIREAYFSHDKELASGLINDFVRELAADALKDERSDFWNKMAMAKAGSDIHTMMECFPKDFVNPSNLVTMLAEENYEIMESFVDILNPTSEVYKNYSGVYSSAEKTRASLEATLHSMVSLFVNDPKLTRFLGKSTFDMKNIARKKTIVYLQTAGEKPAYLKVISLFVTQLFQLLDLMADQMEGRRLKNTVDFVLDEFSTLSRMDCITTALTTARSRNIRFYIVVQSMEQLIEKYGRSGAGIIRGNCQTWIYLFSRELGLLDELSKLAGYRHTAAGPGEPLLSIESLQRLQMGQALIFHRRLKPFVSQMPDVSAYETLKTLTPVCQRVIGSNPPPTIDLKKAKALYLSVRDQMMPFGSKWPVLEKLIEHLKLSGKTENQMNDMFAVDPEEQFCGWNENNDFEKMSLHSIFNDI